MTGISPEQQLLPRLLRGVGREPTTSLDAHVRLHGPLPALARRSHEQLLDELERAGLRGHGGASFPTAKKMRSVAGRRGSKVVVVNGTEGEPASKKDRALLRQAPHLVLDGACLAARAVGADNVFVAFCEHDSRSSASLSAALAERRSVPDEPTFRLFETPELFLSGQETALVNLLNGGPCQPTFGVRPYERGVRQRPTLVQNAETFAHVALIARHGADWFRQLGSQFDPGSALVTISGALHAPGVYEIEHGMPLSALLDTAGPRESLSAVLIGGYFGTWVAAREIATLRLSPTHLRERGASLGAGVIVALGVSACPVAETARVSEWFAEQTAGQCGPCVHGLDAIATTISRMATGTGGRTGHHDVSRWTRELPGRGACQHPDGAARFIASAMEVFADEFRHHAARGRCERCAQRPMLPVPLAARA
ncbi:MAG: NADH-ubiquinone oxidoreductase-F iron-sulfur binding region domain-containing protein [Solirubrobacteraceae bacterium]